LEQIRETYKSDLEVQKARKGSMENELIRLDQQLTQIRNQKNGVEENIQES
jgi:hypothetical protein